MKSLKMLKTHNPGLLITFCGLDGSGKTTMIKLLAEYLQTMNLPVVLTKQPTDFVRSSKMFRTFMDTPNHEEYDYRSLSLLCASDRVQHCNREILPLLNSGHVVISDRYFYSCLANLRARGYKQDKWIYEVSSMIPKPDLAFFMDLEVDTAIAHVRSRESEKDSFIDMPLQHRLRAEYLAIADKNVGITITVQPDPAKTFAAVKSAVDKHLLGSSIHISPPVATRTIYNGEAAHVKV